MSRSVAWRRQLTDAASWHQDEALNATIYILREMGPTGFLLKEEGETKKHKVYLGDPHKCTCQTFMKERDLCKHISWVLLKKFRVPRQNQVTWQLGLVEREINEILRGVAVHDVKVSTKAKSIAQAASNGAEGEEEEEEEGRIKQRPINDDDVCPICQEEFFAKHLPVTYCKFGCGNNIHIKCMKVWADHQKTMAETVIKCPLCREDFGPISLLQQEMRNSSTRGTKAERLGQHLGATCKQCRVAPIVGKCYKCTTCADYHLCQNCFITPVHQSHGFEFREKPSQRWRPAQRGTGSVLPQAVMSAMMSRDLADADYEMLLQLDNQAALAASDLSEETVRSLPTERVRKNGLLMAPGQQCRVCLQRYAEGQTVRKLPCKHKFHRDCIDNWLLHQHATCPVDGMVFTNDSVRAYKEAQKIRQQQRQQGTNPSSGSQSQTQRPSGDLRLEIPGIGIASQGTNPRLGALRSGHLARGPTGVTAQDNVGGILISGTSYNTPMDGGANQSSPLASPAHHPVHSSPLVPVPPSIPRLHTGLDLGIGGQRSTESPQHRPPSGTNRGGSAGNMRGRSRSRGRLTQAAPSTQNRRNSSRTRNQSLERTPSNPDLYLGNSEGELLTNYEGVNRNGSYIEASRRMSNSENSRQLLASNPIEHADDLYIGSEPHASNTSTSSAARLRHGLTSTLGAREQGRAHDAPNNPDLYLGSSEGELLTNHGGPHRNGPSREPLRRMSSSENQRHRVSQANHIERDNLYVGSEPNSISHTPTSSPARLRHGLTSTVGPREQINPRNPYGPGPDLTLTNDHPSAVSNSPDSMYVGTDPASSEGFLRQFLLNSIAQKNLKKTHKTKKDSREKSSDGGRRWGEVREMSGDTNTFVLSGNRVQSQDPLDS